jgi:MFS family permease
MPECCPVGLPSARRFPPPRLLNQEERITPAHWRILAFSWAGWLFDFYDLMLFSFLLVPVRRELNLSQVEAGLLLGLSLGSTAVGGILSGYLSDRFGRKPILQLTILVYSLGTFLCGLAHGLADLALWRIICGLGIGGEWGTGQTYIGETFPPRVRARYAAVMQSGAPLGVALAAVVGGLFAPRFGWRMAFFVSVSPALLTVLVRRWLPESDVWEQASRRRGRVPFENPFGQLLAADLRRPFALAMVLAVLALSAYWFTYSWLPAYLSESRGLSLTKSSLWLLVTQAGGLTGYLSFGLLADRFGRRPAVCAYSLTWATGLLAVTLFWEWCSLWPCLLLFFMFTVGLGTGVFSGFGPIFAELFPTRVRNTAVSTIFNAARGAQFFTPVAIGWIAGRWGLAGGIALAALFAVAMAAWVWTLPETRGRLIEE